jgi:putative oxidoreductase
MRAALHPIARFMMSLIFLLSAFNKLMHFSATAGFIGQLGLPAPQVLLVAAIVFELVGGLGLLVGFKTRFSALLLIIATVLFTAFVHGKLAAAPGQAQEQMVHILKNIALLGGLLKFYLDGPGSYAVDSST